MAAGVPYVNGDKVTLVFTQGSVTGITTGNSYLVGSVTEKTFKVYALTDTALATPLGGGADLASFTSITAALRSDGSAATAAGTFVAEAQSSISANNGKPVRFTITNGGCGYNTVPSITYPGSVGSGIITKGYIASGRLLAVDVHHACDVMPGTVISFPNAGLTATGGSARVTVAIAPFSA
jgi:hypothetical protein